MKLKLSELNPNPFKKEINGGKLKEETIKKIQANIEEIGLMGSIPIFKKDDKYFLVAGHHRVEALKRTFGKDYEVEVTLHDLKNIVLQKYSELKLMKALLDGKRRLADSLSRELSRRSLVLQMQRGGI